MISIQIEIEILNCNLIDYLQNCTILNFLIINLIYRDLSNFLNEQLFNLKHAIIALKNVVKRQKVFENYHESICYLKIKKRVKNALKRQQRFEIVCFIIKLID